jgi:hypothetical protein
MNACKILVIDVDEDDVEILTNIFLESGVDAVNYLIFFSKLGTWIQTIKWLLSLFLLNGCNAGVGSL